MITNVLQGEFRRKAMRDPDVDTSDNQNITSIFDYGRQGRPPLLSYAQLTQIKSVIDELNNFYDDALDFRILSGQHPIHKNAYRVHIQFFKIDDKELDKRSAPIMTLTAEHDGKINNGRYSDVIYHVANGYGCQNKTNMLCSNNFEKTILPEMKDRLANLFEIFPKSQIAHAGKRAI